MVTATLDPFAVIDAGADPLPALVYCDWLDGRGDPLGQWLRASRTLQPAQKFGVNGVKCQGGGETGDVRRGPVVRSQTTGWHPGCDCEDNKPIPALVLDPFAGAGTTLYVATKYGRRGIGCELNPEYAQMARKRIEGIGPTLF